MLLSVSSGSLNLVVGGNGGREVVPQGTQLCQWATRRNEGDVDDCIEIDWTLGRCMNKLCCSCRVFIYQEMIFSCRTSSIK